MRVFFWYLGRTLQLIALLQVGAALLVGMQTSDTKLELNLLMFGAAEFLVGLAILKGTSQQ